MRILVRIKQANQIAITICQFVIHHTVNYKILLLFISKLNLTYNFLSVSSQNIMNDKFGLQVTKAMYIIVA